MKKYKILISSIITLLISAIMIVSYSFAWIINTKNVSHIILHSGEGSLEIRGFLFKRTHTGLTASVPEVPDAVGTLIEDDEGELIFSFGDLPADSFLLRDYVYDEHTLNASYIPSYFLEFQAHTLVEQSFVKISIASEAYLAGETSPDFSSFIYRYHVTDNDSDDPYEYAAYEHFSVIENKAPASFAGNDFIPLTEGTGPGNAYEVIVPLGYETVYTYYFVQSYVVQILPDPLLLTTFIRQNTDGGNTAKTVGMKFVVSIQYSAVPFAS